MFKISLICLSVWGLSVFGQHIFREDYKYFDKVNGWIKLHKIPVKWHDARLRCRAEGASLASPTDVNLKDVMTSVMIAESADPGLGIYSGIHSTFCNGSYATIEGVSISNTPVQWAVGQPDHVYTENCVVFHMNGTLEDILCSDTYEYICYKMFKVLKMTKCNTVDNDYKWDGRTGHCYKFHSFGQTWAQAYMICAAEGGYLAIINDETEAEILKELFAKYPKEILFSKYRNSALIGMREWPDERSWYTVHGQTLKEAGYDRWSNGQPSNYIVDGESQSCGAIDRNGSFDDVTWKTNAAFICEKDPEAFQYFYN